jgi:hypothetical protein
VKRHLADIAERAGWTAAQAGLALLVTEASGLRTWWALPLATALSAAKTWVVHRLPAKAAE